MELGATPQPTPVPQQVSEPVEPSTPQMTWEEAVARQQAELKKAAAEKPKPVPPPTPPKSTPQEQPKPSRLHGALQNPKLSKESKAVLEKLQAEKPFKISIETYGKAIAESILLQTQGIAASRMNFEDGLARAVEFKGGSYGLIYKGKTPLRVAPFTWQLDQGTRRLWAVFTFNNFYGHNIPHPLKSPMGWFRQKISIMMVLTPFNNGSTMVDDYGKGYLAKFDERTQFQVSIGVQDNAEAEQMRVDNKHFISAGLTLWMDLVAATKNKVNMKMIAYLLIGAGIVVFAFWFLKTHPGFLSGILPKGL